LEGSSTATTTEIDAALLVGVSAAIIRNEDQDRKNEKYRWLTAFTSGQEPQGADG
jgi:hypothetical protein